MSDHLEQRSGPPTGSLLQCIEQLEAIVSDRALLAQLPEGDRRRLIHAAGCIAKPDRFARRKLVKEFHRQEKRAASAANIAAKSTTGVRQARTAATFTAPAEICANLSPRQDKTSELLVGRQLAKAQPCYVCKTSYTELHFFYDSMCPACASFNYSKRFQTANCRGRTALVTGARVKIGFQAALMLLRAGAQVIVTTRFPHDAALRYRQELDFSDWHDRLQIYGIDLRHAPSVESFAQHLNETYQGLDFLLNNAAQTVRKPRGFYDHLMAAESQLPHDADARKLLSGFLELQHAPQHRVLAPTESAGGLLSYAADRTDLRLHASARMSQVPLLPEDFRCGSDVFPTGCYDADRQQVDLRDTNSWRMQLADVSTAEMLEIQLINAVAPFILCSKLKPLMQRRTTNDKHIVNVSAMEGKFTRYTKTDKHPHTNMAKAALNMMTQTSAPDYVQSGIHMNAVDTGWVTDEDPAQHAQRKREELGFEPPLDIVDGAARIVDPFFHGLNTGEHVWGKFLKDYQPTTW